MGQFMKELVIFLYLTPGFHLIVCLRFVKTRDIPRERLFNKRHQSLKNLSTDVEKITADVWQKAGKREQDDDLYPPPEAVEKHLAETMWNAIKESRESLERSLPNGYKNAVTKKLHNIVFDDYRSDGLCTIDLGIDPSIVKRQIADIANLTKMPEKLHDIFQSAVYVNGAGAKQAESAAIAANGSFHYILVAVNRKDHNSLGSGMAVFSVHYKIAPEAFQTNKDEVNEFVRFASAVDNVGRLTFKGREDMAAYFQGKAVEMYLEKCPAILKRFQQVTKELE